MANAFQRFLAKNMRLEKLKFVTLYKHLKIRFGIYQIKLNTAY